VIGALESRTNEPAEQGVRIGRPARSPMETVQRAEARETSLVGRFGFEASAEQLYP
jgi:hypothetical protein